MFTRSVCTSTFVERTFSAMTRWTRTRQSLATVASKHVATVFKSGVERLQERLHIERQSSKSRPVWVKSTTPGYKLTGLHKFATEVCKGMDFATQLHAWQALSAAERREWSSKAKSKRIVLAPVLSPLDAFLSEQICHHASNAGHMWGLADPEAQFPLARHLVQHASRSGSEFQATVARWISDPVVAALTTCDPDFPETVDTPHM